MAAVSTIERQSNKEKDIQIKSNKDERRKRIWRPWQRRQQRKGNKKKKKDTNVVDMAAMRELQSSTLEQTSKQNKQRWKQKWKRSRANAATNSAHRTQQSNIMDSIWVLRGKVEEVRACSKRPQWSNQRLGRHLRQQTTILHTADIAHKSTDNEMDNQSRRHFDSIPCTYCRASNLHVASYMATAWPIQGQQHSMAIEQSKYGLRSPKACQDHLADVLKQLGLTRLKREPTLYRNDVRTVFMQAAEVDKLLTSIRQQVLLFYYDQQAAPQHSLEEKSQTKAITSRYTLETKEAMPSQPQGRQD